MKLKLVAVLLSAVVCFSIVGCSKTGSDTNSDAENAEVVSDDQVEDETGDNASAPVTYESTDERADTTLSNGTIEISLYDDAGYTAANYIISGFTLGFTIL
ncbi:hypothetical protein [Butyrivibrio fibrisolvens]|uniref:hypothetical protein n=1 Tax=Butyrivibrio fibrisolvens TaxID=831 RepID=UPI0004063857|nr:hypothetical protein [Butyrivibrio fibrisolvens]